MPEINTVYGEGILSSEINKIDKYVVITDEVPWEIFKSSFSKQPVDVLMPESLEQSDLDKMVDSIPLDAELVGLGGGSMIDACKYFAVLRDKEPILVPTITSSNAQFSDFISVRRNGRPFGMKEDNWPKKVIVDYDLIKMSEKRYNRAGYGDFLFMQTTLNDWKIASEKGKGIPYDQEIGQQIDTWMKYAIENSEVIGSVDSEGIKILMKLFEESTDFAMSNQSLPINAGSEHLFAWNLEGVTNRHFIHGEIVSLGIVIASYLQKSHYKELRQALDLAGVVYQPEKLGISWDEIKETLLTVNDYNEKVRHFNTIFQEVDWDQRLFDEIYDWIYLSRINGQ